MTPEEQNDLLNRIDERVGHIKEDMKNLCAIAKSKEGFNRCATRWEKIQRLEREHRLIVALLITGAVKVTFF